jgi:hypothetical protein
MDKISIPIALQVCFDDIAWDDGRDLRLMGQASRTGIPRRHTYEDYEAVHLLGKGIGQRIVTPLCLADWDKDNLLFGEIGITHDPHGWNRAAELKDRIGEFERYAALMDASDSFDITVHGLLHGHYDENGKQVHEHEFFHTKRESGVEKDGPIPKWDFERRMDLFFKIYRSWGFKKEIKNFVSPGGTYGDTEGIETLASWLYERGIRNWTNKYPFKDPVRSVAGVTCVTSGGAMPGTFASPPWNSYDFDPEVLGHFVSHENRGGVATFSMHWPNILRFNPRKNAESIGRWIDYFKSEAEIFGTMISKDLAFAGNQLFYHHYTKIEKTAVGYILDVSEAKAKKSAHHPDTFYISLKKGLRPTVNGGATLALFEEHRDFDTYEIRHSATDFELLI